MCCGVVGDYVQRCAAVLDSGGDSRAARCEALVLELRRGPAARVEALTFLDWLKKQRCRCVQLTSAPCEAAALQNTINLAACKTLAIRPAAAVAPQGPRAH